MLAEDEQQVLGNPLDPLELSVGKLDAEQHLLTAAVQKKSALGIVCLVVAILIYSSNSAVYQAILVADPQLFTACNVLCAQNFVGLAALLPFYWRHLTVTQLRRQTQTEWLALCVGTLFYSVLGPFFNLTALSTLPVASVAILQQLEPVWLVIFAYLVFKEKVDRWSGANMLLNVIGVAMAVATAPLFGQAIVFEIGSVYQLLSSVFYVASLLLSNVYLKQVPMGLLVVFRALFGSIAYMLLSMAMQGSTREFFYQFSELALWKHMWWYGLLYSAVAMATWLTALKQCDPTTLSIGTSSKFIFTILFAMLIRQQFPSGPQCIGSGFILVSVVSGMVRMRAISRNARKTSLGAAAPVAPPAAAPTAPATAAARPAFSYDSGCDSQHVHKAGTDGAKKQQHYQYADSSLPIAKSREQNAIP